MTIPEMRILKLEEFKDIELRKAEYCKQVMEKTKNPFKRKRYRKYYNGYLILAEAYDDIIIGFEETFMDR